MPLVTFSSPLHKDKTVYAVAGSHTKTLLTLAKENHIPIDFSCQDGECGTCLIKVTNLTKKGPMGGPLTDRELTVLKDMGKITQADIDAMKVDDVPHTSWRLACQMIVRDEDILVEYPSR
jgi:ferredoxin